MTHVLPPAVAAFQAALSRLPGLRDVSSSFESLEGLDATRLSSFAYTHLPIAAFRRTSGALPNEGFMQFTFRLLPEPASWRTLEFLAWWVHDQARGGQSIQLRSVALPPVAGAEVQLGRTLAFHIDLFRANAVPELAPHLAALEQLAMSLSECLRLYNSMLVERGAHPISATEA